MDIIIVSIPNYVSKSIFLALQQGFLLRLKRHKVPSFQRAPNKSSHLFLDRFGRNI